MQQSSTCNESKTWKQIACKENWISIEMYDNNEMEIYMYAFVFMFRIVYMYLFV